jgi:hypothetical protein
MQMVRNLELRWSRKTEAFVVAMLVMVPKKFCSKENCVVASHKEAKKFDPADEGSVVTAES